MGLSGFERPSRILWLGVGAVFAAWISAAVAVAASYSSKTKYFCEPLPHHSLRVGLVSVAIAGAVVAILAGCADMLIHRSRGRSFAQPVGMVLAGLTTLVGAPLLYLFGTTLLLNHVGC